MASGIQKRQSQACHLPVGGGWGRGACLQTTWAPGASAAPAAASDSVWPCAHRSTPPRTPPGCRAGHQVTAPPDWPSSSSTRPLWDGSCRGACLVHPCGLAVPQGACPRGRTRSGQLRPPGTAPRSRRVARQTVSSPVPEAGRPGPGIGRAGPSSGPSPGRVDGHLLLVSPRGAPLCLRPSLTGTPVTQLGATPVTSFDLDHLFEGLSPRTAPSRAAGAGASTSRSGRDAVQPTTALSTASPGTDVSASDLSVQPRPAA